MGLRHRFVVRFAIEDDLRFISHHDTVRLFERALARAEWPVKFSEGFNPRPRLSLPLPRSVGIASEDELLVIELTEAVAPDAALCQLRRQMPSGIRLWDILALTTSANPAPRQAVYEAPVESPPPEWRQRIEDLSQRTAIIVRRTGQDERVEKQLDIRPYIVRLAIEDNRLIMVLRITPTGTARPAEVLAALGLAECILPHRLRRTRVEWENLGATRAPQPTDAVETPGEANA